GTPSLDPGIQLKTLKLTFEDTASLPKEDVIDRAKEFLDGRLKAEIPVSPEESEEFEASSEDADTPLVEDGGEVEEEEEGEPFEIGQSILRNLRERLDEPGAL